MLSGKPKNVGFISFRLSGLDGVSLESEKWAMVLEQEGIDCFYMAGELDRPSDRSFLVKEAHFSHSNIKKIYKQCFHRSRRKPAITQKINQIKDKLKGQLYDFIEKCDLNCLIVENVLAIPLNIPLSLAITEVISETAIPTIAHHHDFFWERQRFLTNAVWDYLNMAFPPHLPSVRHVVLNSSADNQLSLRTGISASIIPNVMDFDNPPSLVDDYSSDIRQAFGIEDDQLLILQPTRVVGRKGIEHSIELVKRLGMKAKLVITHASVDEGYDYEVRVKDYAEIMNVDTVFESNIIKQRRGKTSTGNKIYSLFDVYPHADLVTYPSGYEGFGNAFLEAVYFRKPMVVNLYSIYETDIKPKGFRAIELPGYVDDKVLAHTREIITNPELCEKIVDHNYKLGKRYYSYYVLQRKLKNLLFDMFGS